MKTVLERPVVRPYRNERIFRSAELLLAAPPPKRPSPRPPRWFVFVVGLILGAGLGIVAWNNRHPSPAPEPASPASVTSAPRPRPAVGLPTPSRPAAPKPPESLSSTSAPTHAPVPETPQAETAEPAAERPLRYLGGTPSLAPAQFLQFSHDPVTMTGRAVARLSLHGELRSDTGAPIRVGIELWWSSRAGEVGGSVTYFDGDFRIASNLIAGKRSGDHLTLRETERLWVKPTLEYPIGRELTLRFPSDPLASELTGFWSLGGTRGRLQLSTGANHP